MTIHRKTQQVLARLQMPVLACLDSETIVLAQHRCTNKACRSELVLNHMAAAACPVCASTMEVVNPEQTIELTPEQQKELPHVGDCKMCGTQYAGPAEAVANLDGNKGFCCVCTSDLDFAMDEDEDEDAEADAEEVIDGEEDDLGAEDGAEEVVDAEIESEAEDPAAFNYEGNGDDPANAMPLDDAEAATNVIDEVTEEAEALVDDEPPSDDESEESEDDEDEDEEVTAGRKDMRKDRDTKVTKKVSGGRQAATASVKPKQPKLRINALARVMTAASAQIDLVPLGKGLEQRCFIFADNKAVAVAHRAKAAEQVQANFDNFPTILQAAIDNGFTDEAQKDLGIEPTEVEVPIDEAQALDHEKRIGAATAALSKQRQEVKARFQRNVGIASVGLIKGVFTGEKNPLREALIAELAQVQVRNPAKLVDAVLSKHTEEFLRAIITKAEALGEKTDEALDEVAEMVSTASYRHETTASETEAPNRTVIPFTALSEPQHSLHAAAEESVSEADHMRAVVRSIPMGRYR